MGGVLLDAELGILAIERQDLGSIGDIDDPLCLKQAQVVLDLRDRADRGAQKGRAP